MQAELEPQKDSVQIGGAPREGHSANREGRSEERFHHWTRQEGRGRRTEGTESGDSGDLVFIAGADWKA